MERPALTRLIERFEKRGVGLVAVTQHLDTSMSMGRLTLNILLSFAQFEREIMSERARDKIAAARRRGKWTGGPLILGCGVEARPCAGRSTADWEQRRMWEGFNASFHRSGTRFM